VHVQIAICSALPTAEKNVCIRVADMYIRGEGNPFLRDKAVFRYVKKGKKPCEKDQYSRIATTAAGTSLVGEKSLDFFSARPDPGT